MSIATNIASIMNELPSTVKLVAVSKFHPLEAILEAYDAGQRVFAESRPQELKDKVEHLGQIGGHEDIEWHFIGHLQTNKLKMVLPYVSLVQSVDSRRLMEAIGVWAESNGKTVDVLLEMHISSEASKQGFTFDEASALLKDMESLSGPFSRIRVRGLMGMASLTDDEDIIRNEFLSLVRYADMFAEMFAGSERIGMEERSFGMTGDYPLAVRTGSTMVRIGTAIFGERQY